MDETLNLTDHGFHGGHIALIGGVACALLFFSFIKNPELFQLRSRSAAGAGAQSQTAPPRYYAYVAPPQPAVLGANTLPPGPSVINEDGSISSLSDFGQVLGESIDRTDIQTDLDSMHFRTVSSTEQSVRGYLDYVTNLEAQYLVTGELETALVSDAKSAQVTETLNKLQALVTALEGMYVPEDALQVHKLTLVQYRAAADLLKNFAHLNDNPELVTQKLGAFMTAQDQLSSAQQNLFEKYQLL